jgi:hypothetical protein
VVLVWFLPWGLAVVAGWDAAALTFLAGLLGRRCAAPVTGRGDAGTPPGDNG